MDFNHCDSTAVYSCILDCFVRFLVTCRNLLFLHHVLQDPHSQSPASSDHDEEVNAKEDGHAKEDGRQDHDEEDASPSTGADRRRLGSRLPPVNHSNFLFN